MQISRQQTAWLKGIAIAFMVGHHLFAFPERIDPAVTVQHLLPWVNLERAIAGFEKICVPMFLFLSGYGFAMSKARGWRDLLKKSWGIYSQFWLVCLIFVPLGVVWFNGSGNYSLEPANVLLNLSGLSTTWNGEWWFLVLYIAYLFTLPLMRNLSSGLLLGVGLLLLVAGNLSFRYFHSSWIERDIGLYGMWLLPFICGFLAGRHKEDIDSLVHQALQRRLFWPLSVLFIVAVYGATRLPGFANLGLALVTPLFIVLCLDVCQRLPGWSKAVLAELGQRSTFIWLTHTFYCYYFFQQMIYAPRFTPLIYLLLLVVSWLTSVVLGWIYQQLFTRPKMPDNRIPT
ncbi:MULTISPECIES: acyltransferase family protein [Erwinia]|uniref:acyltransferase family protein n=1 Tax=Erwinia TaxID=551 RepID=UPI00105F1A7C|nr:acyltransferase [Erwinia aphidicola]MCP2231096.1 hypothetical protein [Erwinia aphidicola]